MPKINFRDKLRDTVILFDGATGTELYNKGVFINRCFDEINLSNPELIKRIHKEYKAAGADVLETNTFGANKHKLQTYQLDDKVYLINKRAAEIAREVAEDDIYVAGSVGPLAVKIEPLGSMSLAEAKDAFKEQMRGLIDGGVDLFILETFVYPEELRQAVNAAKELCDLPIVAQITIDEDMSTLTGASAEVIIKEMASFGADAIGVNCTVGPQIMLEWLEIVRPLTDLPISIMPNAGKPKNIDGRNIYLASPEYFAEYTKHLIQKGAGIIGGCCGTSPEHIKLMRNAVNALKPRTAKVKYELKESEKIADVTPVPRQDKSRLARRISDGHFVKFVELLSPHGVSAKIQIEKAREMNYYGIDVINIPDGPRASARMSALSLAVLLQREVGIETVLHYVCRDRNVIGMQSDLLGAYALGVKNILAITGDPPKLGNYPDATAVFDVDSIGLVNILNRLNHGSDIAGSPFGEPTGFYVGVGANPGALNLDEELKRLDWKIEAGAEYIITQPVFDIDLLYNFIEKIKAYDIPLIAGLWPLVSIRNAEFMNNELPGCHVPDNILDRLRKVQSSKADSLAVGTEIARETLKDIQSQIQGLQISAPFGRVETVKDVLRGMGL
ncbi:MAG: bifunctional homocysteine S-methyltransferase/methylenetetrahydrofolate reductase [Candidatus Kapabacteria bacterium]|jgi:methionine synthase I (cobalamin-dependent)/5,10-methylenetetrahydrofolate reductase|nr:bifunctional homocysteine S-methyltransferase/methylenetetrahydrofolate reductase [Candidatus Kapabacteria bacterium]